MRIVTYNIHGWRTKDGAPNIQQIAQTLQACQADVIGLNEVYYPIREGLPQSQNGLEWLADRLQMHFAFGPCVRWPATQDLPERSYGNALLSRYPIVASAAHHLTPVEGKEQRGLLEARLALENGQTFTVYITHLDHTDEEARLVQLRALRSWTVRDRNRPHAVLGDFNAIQPWEYDDAQEKLQAMIAQHPPSAYLVAAGKGPRVIPQMEKAGYTDAMRLAGDKGQGTFIPASVPVRIDYIWLSPALEPALRACAVWQEPAGQEASDHRPVYAELDLSTLEP